MLVLLFQEQCVSEDAGSKPGKVVPRELLGAYWLPISSSMILCNLIVLTQDLGKTHVWLSESEPVILTCSQVGEDRERLMEGSCGVVGGVELCCHSHQTGSFLVELQSLENHFRSILLKICQTGEMAQGLKHLVLTLQAWGYEFRSPECTERPGYSSQLVIPVLQMWRELIPEACLPGHPCGQALGSTERPYLREWGHHMYTYNTCICTHVDMYIHMHTTHIHLKKQKNTRCIEWSAY